MAKKRNNKNLSDVLENRIREEMPDVLDILLIDRTKTTKRKVKNIVWASSDYQEHGAAAYAPSAQILPEQITGKMGGVIRPRALKSQKTKKDRTKAKAEVFTPTWVVKLQNDEVEKSFIDDDLATYIKRKWLEITCGEAPYMVTRYDMVEGEFLPLDAREGFVDRKLRRINEEINDKVLWQDMVENAYKASYGFEWSGDSLLLARENLLYTYRDYYFDKWEEEPTKELFAKIAEIISYNIFQMDGLNLTIPFTEKVQKTSQMSLFGDEVEIKEKKPGIHAKVMNWDTNKMEKF